MKAIARSRIFPTMAAFLGLLAATMIPAGLAQAALNAFTNRVAWQAAAGTITGSENFNGFVVDTPFGGAGNELSLSGGMTIGSQLPPAFSDEIVDVVPLVDSQNDVDGTASARVFNQETPFLLFSPPISAFGADFRALNDTLQRTGVAIYDGLTLLDTLQPSTEPDITRFWGFSADAGELITEIRFTYIDNDVFGIDNIETVQVPEPATLLLVIGGLAGLVGLRRRW